MRPQDILDVELEEEGRIRRGKVEILFHRLRDPIAATDRDIDYSVCKLISGNIPNHFWQAVRQGDNIVRLIPWGNQIPGKRPRVLRILHREDEIPERQCPKCKAHGSQERETKKSLGVIHSIIQTCSKCHGTGWIRVV